MAAMLQSLAILAIPVEHLDSLLPVCQMNSLFSVLVGSPTKAIFVVIDLSLLYPYNWL